MSKQKEYGVFDEHNKDGFLVKYNTQEILIKNNIDLPELSITFCNGRKEIDIYNNIVSISNIIGNNVLRFITVNTLCQVSKNLREIRCTRTLKSSSVNISYRGFKLLNKEFNCYTCKRFVKDNCYQCLDINLDWKKILAEVLFHYRKYLIDLTKCKSGTVAIGNKDTMKIGDLIKKDRSVYIIEDILITPGCDFIVVKFKNIPEYFIESEIEVAKNKIQKSSQEYDYYMNICSIVNGVIDKNYD